MVYKKSLIFFFLSLLFYCNKEASKKEIHIHRENLIAQKNQSFDYVEGNIIDVRNVSIEYLKGDILGDKNLNLFINVMKGNVAACNVKINILEGNIISGDNISVNVLIGEDFTGKACVLKKIDKNL